MSNTTEVEKKSIWQRAISKLGVAKEMPVAVVDSPQLSKVWGIDMEGRAVRPEGERLTAQVAPVLPEKPQAELEQNFPLQVPYEQKTEARNLGARWDKEAKQWFVPAGMDREPFRNWWPQPEVALDPVKEFTAVLKQNGFMLEHDAIMDGKLHRSPVMGDKGKEQKGSYVGHLDGIKPAGWFQNFREMDQVERWKLAGKVQGPRVSAQTLQDMEHKRREVEKVQMREYALAAARAEKIWEQAVPATDEHPYLKLKGVPENGEKVGAKGQTIEIRLVDGNVVHRSVEGQLITPIFDEQGKMASLQFISPSSDPEREGKWDKKYLQGSRTENGHRIIGEELMERESSHETPLIVCEGLATGKSLHLATGHPVAIAYSAGNLSRVAELYQAIDPERPIYPAADNDHQRPLKMDSKGQPKKNVGLEAAQNAAAAIGSVALVPTFDKNDRSTDFNDLHRTQSLSAVRSKVLTDIAMSERGQDVRGFSTTHDRGRGREQTRSVAVPQKEQGQELER